MMSVFHVYRLKTSWIIEPKRFICLLPSVVFSILLDDTFCLVWYTTVSLCAHSAETVNDGQFHTVELLTFNHMLNLSVDGGEPTTLDSQRRSNVAAAAAEAPLYVGGKTTCPVSAAPGAPLWLNSVAMTPHRDA